MNCPNCDHKINDSALNKFSIAEGKMKLLGVCDQCGKLINFVLNQNNEDCSVKCYAWLDEKEKKYSKDLSSISQRKYVLYIPPNTERNGLLDRIGQFSISHGCSSAFIFSESFSDIIEKIKNIYSIVVLPNSLFPELPSYIAEKLIAENITGELFSTERTLYNRFRKI